MPPSTFDVNWLSPIHTDDKVNSRQNRRHSRQWTLSLLFESRLSPAHLTLSTMSWSTLSPKLNMFNSVDFVKVGNFCRPNVERRFDFVSSVYRVKETRRPCRIRLCLQCVQGQRNTSTMSNSTVASVYRALRCLLCCRVPCSVYYSWWNLRMSVMRKKDGMFYYP